MPWCHILFFFFGVIFFLALPRDNLSSVYLMRPQAHLMALLCLQGHVNWSFTEGYPVAL